MHVLQTFDGQMSSSRDDVTWPASRCGGDGSTERGGQSQDSTGRLPDLSVRPRASSCSQSPTHPAKPAAALAADRAFNAVHRREGRKVLTPSTGWAKKVSYCTFPYLC